MEKVCNICGISKPLIDFCRRADSKDGRESRCRHCRTIQAREYCKNNREKIRLYKREWCLKNKGKKREYNQRRRQRHYKYPANAARYYAKVHTRISYRLNAAMKANIWQSLQGKKNGRKWETLVGYTLEELKAHLEKLFQSEMNWANYGKWHIDHIRPKNSFSFTTYNDKGFKDCWRLSNLQPLWAVDNIRKSDETV